MSFVAAVLQHPTLVLNRDWTPIQTTTTRQAIGLVAGGAARIVDPLTYEVHDLVSWNAVSRVREKFSDMLIRSMRLSILKPEVIVLTHYSGIGRRSVVFSRRNLFRRDHYTCQYCGSQPPTRDLSIDHVVPKSRGGQSTWANCVVACFGCNRRKANRTPSEAGMHLRQIPKKPAWNSFLNIPREKRCESWNKFLSGAYWDIELEP